MIWGFLTEKASPVCRNSLTSSKSAISIVVDCVLKSLEFLNLIFSDLKRLCHKSFWFKILCVDYHSVESISKCGKTPRWLIYVLVQHSALHWLTQHGDIERDKEWELMISPEVGNLMTLYRCTFYQGPSFILKCFL